MRIYERCDIHTVARLRRATCWDYLRVATRSPRASPSPRPPRPRGCGLVHRYDLETVLDVLDIIVGSNVPRFVLHIARPGRVGDPGLVGADVHPRLGSTLLRRHPHVWDGLGWTPDRRGPRSSSLASTANGMLSSPTKVVAGWSRRPTLYITLLRKIQRGYIVRVHRVVGTTAQRAR